MNRGFIASTDLTHRKVSVRGVHSTQFLNKHPQTTSSLFNNRSLIIDSEVRCTYPVHHTESAYVNKESRLKQIQESKQTNSVGTIVVMARVYLIGLENYLSK